MNKLIESVLKLLQAKEISKQAAHLLITEYEREGKSRAHLLKQGEDQIAVIGMSCRMPKSQDSHAFWNHLIEGVDCIGEFPQARRRDTDRYLQQIDPDLFLDTHSYWPGGFLDRVDLFDPQFFNITLGEAKYIDPQQRLFLEVAYEAMEDAGYTGERIATTRTGVYIGHCDNEYKAAIQEVVPAAVPGNLVPFIASRVAFTFDLHGPAVSVATTCSSSMVALHMACQALRSNDCEMAIVGAANLYLFPVNVRNDSVVAVGISSEDHRCRTFDSQASGVVRGEGSIALMLKPLHRAVQDRDQVHAVILGSAVNNDGHSSSLTAPNPSAQAQMLVDAWEKARIDPRTISYIEAHGTGTQLGDPIEIQALTKAFSHFTEDRQFCGIGSLKTNIGHLVSGGSGLAGVLKTILSLKHRTLPGILHFKAPNPLIDFENSPVFIVDQNTKWDPSPLRAGVSAFGFNGTNSHVVLEEFTASTAGQNPLSQYILPISANSPGVLKNLISDYLHFIEHPPFQFSCVDLCYTAGVRRVHRTYRVCFVFKTFSDLKEQIEFFLSQSRQRGGITDANAENFLNGKEVNWEALYRDISCRTLSLPFYRFERKRIWLDEVQEEVVGNFYHMPSTKHCAEEPALDDEARFLSLCRQVLGLKTIQLEDDFFELGGDSLQGIQLINSIHQSFHKKLSLDHLFNSKSLKEILNLTRGSEHQRFEKIPVQKSKGKVVCSAAQKRLWLLDQMQDERNAYNMSDAYRFVGDFEIALFREALEWLVRRHESLRTTFCEEEGIPYQQVMEETSLDFDVVEASLEASPGILSTFVEKPFDLEKGPLLRSILISVIGSDQTIFSFSVHHTVCDGWSLHLMMREVVEIYQARLQLQEVDLPSLHVQYRDYAVWQSQPSYQASLQHQEDYWMQQLGGDLPLCEIRGDQTRPAVFHFQGQQASFSIERSIAIRLKEIAKGNGSSLYMVLLATVYIMIHRYSGQRDLIIGSPVSGRSHEDLCHIIGCFINTLALRISLDPSQSFLEFLKNVRTIVLKAFENQDYPFDRLVDKLRPLRDPSRPPLFNINVVLQNIDKQLDSIKLGNTQVEPFELIHNTSKWDLEFEFSEKQDGSLYCALEYYTGAYSDEMVQVLIESYQKILQSIVDNPKAPIFQIDALPEEHLQLMTRALTGSLSTRKDSLVTLFTRQSQQTPEAIAIEEQEKYYTYQDLEILSNRIARLILNNSSGKETRIGILMENAYETIACLLGALKARATYVPLEVSHPFERLKAIVISGQISIVFCFEQQLRLAEDLQWQCGSLGVIYMFPTVADKGNELMDERLWDFVADKASDDIQASGWVSSYTGLPFAHEEMQEYRENILAKLKPHLKEDLKVLEIGCGSGLTMETIAPHVGIYVGTDLSRSVLLRTAQKAKDLGLSQFRTFHLKANEIDQMPEKDFNLIILNSVVHCFPSLAYLKSVLGKIIKKISLRGMLFLGDIMDLDSKDQLIDSLHQFQRSNLNSKTKIDFDTELFVSKIFFEDLGHDLEGISEVQFSKKRGYIKNELSLFRYDVILQIDKTRCRQRGVGQARKQQIDLSHSAIDQVTPEGDFPPPDLDRPVYILFTSGSTGAPKGVVVSQRSLLQYISWASSFYFRDLNPLYMPLFTPLCFDLTVTSIFCPLLNGGTIKIYRGEYQDIISNISSHAQINAIKMTPSHLSYAVDAQIDLSQVKKMILGGEPLYGDLVAQVCNETEVYNEYGPTEATVGCIVHSTSSSKAVAGDRVPIGVPIEGTQVYLFDESGGRVPLGGIGELYLAGACLAVGYLRQEQLTDEKFAYRRLDAACCPRMYRTADRCRFLPDGELEYLGRTDRQVNVRSYRVELGEIESRMRRYPPVKEAVVTLHGKGLTGYFSHTERVNIDDLKVFLQKDLPSYMMPNHFVGLSSFKLNAHGKIDLNSLPDDDGENVQFRAPERAIQKKLARIWENILSVHPIGLADDFFDLGGDSISAMRMLTQGRKANIHLSIKDIFQYRTLEKLADHAHQDRVIHKQQNSSPRAEIPLSPIQHWFFGQRFENPNFFNMGYLFSIPQETDLQKLEVALQQTLARHEMLRARFVIEGSQIHQVIIEQFDFHVKRIDLRRFPYDDQCTRIEDVAQRTQHAIDIGKNLLVMGVIFDLGDRGLRLLILIHHLIVDGVSWRILAEDIQTDYWGAETTDVELCSFGNWTEKLYALDRSKLSIEYWAKIAKDCPNFLTLTSPSQRFQSSYRHDQLILSPEDTCALCATSGKDSNLHSVLIALFGRCCAESMNAESIWLDTELMGRDCGLADLFNCDISRTVGWFTSLFPVLYERQISLEADIEFMDNVFNQICYSGMPYMLMRQRQHSELRKLPVPQILFNYFGKVEKSLLSDRGLLQPATENFGGVWDRRNARPYLLEINAIILDQKLHFEIEWHIDCFSQGQLNEFRSKLVEKISLLNLAAT